METFRDNLANEIYRLYNDESLREELSFNAQKTYKNYSPETYGLRLKQIYKQIYAN